MSEVGSGGGGRGEGGGWVRKEGWGDWWWVGWGMLDCWEVQKEWTVVFLADAVAPVLYIDRYGRKVQRTRHKI